MSGTRCVKNGYGDSQTLGAYRVVLGIPSNELGNLGIEGRGSECGGIQRLVACGGGVGWVKS